MEISNYNTHSYYGSTVEAYAEVQLQVPIIQHHSGKAALFLYGSKVAHSCSPNVAYSSRTIDEKLEYKAIQSIQKLRYFWGWRLDQIGM